MRRASAGAALPETALVITTVLLIMIGGLRIGLVGYTQMTVDAAAFTQARLTAVDDPQAALKTTTAIPRIAAGDMTTDIGLPPSAQVPVDYNLGDSSNRHGGMTMMQPLQIVTKVLKNDLDGILLGSGGNVAVHGFSVAPAYRDFLAHDNVLGQDVNSVQAFDSAQNYFTHGENVPPFFVGFHYFKVCDSDLNSGPWTTCPGTTVFAALGLAEYLDHDNWGRSSPGIAGDQAVFKEMLCHQRKFAAVAAVAFAADTRAAAESALTMSVPDISTIYSWDARVSGGYPPDSYTPGDYPLAPAAGC